jgi:hypothetical protein
MATIGSEFKPIAIRATTAGCAGSRDMRRSWSAFAIAAVAIFGGWASLTSVDAAPPTVTPSPGYDARLQEQRAARTMYKPAARYAVPVSRRHAKRIHAY